MECQPCTIMYATLGTGNIAVDKTIPAYLTSSATLKILTKMERHPKINLVTI